MGEGPAEVSMGVLGVLLNNGVEVEDCLLMFINHLIGLSSLMDVADVTLDELDAFREGKDSLLEFLLVAVGQSDVVVQISFVGQEGLIIECTSKHLPSQRSYLNCFLEFLIRVVRKAKLVVDLWIVGAYFECLL